MKDTKRHLKSVIKRLKIYAKSVSRSLPKRRLGKRQRSPNGSYTRQAKRWISMTSIARIRKEWKRCKERGMRSKRISRGSRRRRTLTLLPSINTRVKLLKRAVYPKLKQSGSKRSSKWLLQCLLLKTQALISYRLR